LTIKKFGCDFKLGVGPLVRYEGAINAQDYIDALEEYLLQTLPFLEYPFIGEQESHNND